MNKIARQSLTDSGMPRRWMRRTSAVALLCCLIFTGCGEETKTPAELGQTVRQAEIDAQAACDRTDVGAVDAAVAQAEPLLAELDKLAHPTPAAGTPDPAQPLDPAAAAALAEWSAAAIRLQTIRDWAALTHEKKIRDDRLKSVKAWTYRQGRNLAVKGLLSGLAYAAGQAQTKGLSALPPVGQNLAQQAAGLTGCPPLADGSTDWAAVVVKLNGWSTTPPPGVAILLGVGWLALRQTDLALVEIDLAGIPEEVLTAPTPVAGLSVPATVPAVPPPFDPQRLLMRALIYRENELPRLASLDEARVDRLYGAGGSGTATDSTAYLQMVLHGYRFYMACEQKDHTAADRELAEMLRRAPDSPFTVLLTGERQLAAGNSGQAANGLETWLADHASDPEMVWWVEKIQARARAVRNSAGSGEPPPPFLLNREFLLEAVEHLQVGPPPPPDAEANAAPDGFARDLLQGTALVGQLTSPDAQAAAPVLEQPDPAPGTDTGAPTPAIVSPLAVPATQP